MRAARWPSVPIVFCETRKLAEQWTYRWIAAAVTWARTEPAARVAAADSAADDYQGGEREPSTAVGSSTVNVRVRRIYDEPVLQDGARVLVDRVWPRGVTKASADLADWCRQVAPSTALRTWYGHDPAKFEEFARRYRAELEEPERAAALQQLRDLALTGPLTLLTATRDPDLSQAAVLADLLRH